MVPAPGAAYRSTRAGLSLAGQTPRGEAPAIRDYRSSSPPRKVPPVASSEPLPLRVLVPPALRAIALRAARARARRWDPRSRPLTPGLLAGGDAASGAERPQAAHDEVKHPRAVPTLYV